MRYFSESDCQFLVKIDHFVRKIRAKNIMKHSIYSRNVLTLHLSHFE